jgi:HSP20 family molecular chaperone IbpA
MVTGIQDYTITARLVTQMRDLTVTAAKEGRAFSQEEQTKWAKIEADEASLTATIDAHKKAEELEARSRNGIQAR